MWEPGTSTSRGKRSWSRLSRQTFSPVPSSPTWGGDSADAPQRISSISKSPAVQKDDSSSEGSSFLQTLRKLLRDFDQLHAIDGIPLSDHRVVLIKQEIEKVLPRLYLLADDKASDPLSSQARIVKMFAEEHLKKFPDVSIDELRAKYAPDTSGAKSSANAEGPRHAPEVPPAGEKHRPDGSGRISPRPPQFKEQTEGVSHGTSSSSSRKILAEITSEQESMLTAIHEMLGSNATSVFDPPAALSPEEVQMRLSSTGEVQSHASRPQEMHSVSHSLAPHPLSGQNMH